MKTIKTLVAKSIVLGLIIFGAISCEDGEDGIQGVQGEAGKDGIDAEIILKKELKNVL